MEGIHCNMIFSHRAPGHRVGCSVMHGTAMFTALITLLSPPNTITGSPAMSASIDGLSPISTTPPVVFKKIQRPTSKILGRGEMTKSDSPMLNYIFDSYATSNKHFHDKFKAPSFEGDSTLGDMALEADTGATVVFNCSVSSLRDKMVSWLRVSDEDNLELLTLDLERHTADSRYRVDIAGETWHLALSNAKASDSGIYCCHVSTHPPMTKRFRLVVHRPEMNLTKEAFLETSETLSLKCMIIHLDPGGSTPALRWYKGNSSIPLDEIRGGVLIETDQLMLTSQLQVARLKVDDAGNYTCALHSPLKMKAVARVHVLQGSSLAELQSGVKTTTCYLNLLLAAILVVLGSYSDVR